MNSNIMELLPLERLGAIARPDNPYVIDFGIFLPGISASDGNKLWVKIIHEHDQFLQGIEPHSFELINTEINSDYGEYWTVKVDIQKHEKRHEDSQWGTEGTYVYRYCLKNPNKLEEIDWIIDPFAREFGAGKLSAITVGYKDHEWSEHEKNEWKTPALNDLVIYELMINEFGGGIDGTIKQLDYLADLGVNCIKLMPISNVATTVDWGYEPIGYFGVDERFGKRCDLQKLIDAAHQRKMAVLLDVVYAHVDKSFAYSYVYEKLGIEIGKNRFLGDFAHNGFGGVENSTDFNKKFTRDFFFTVNHYLLDRYHADGFRYDYVPGFWDEPMGNGYANLTYHTYQTVKEKEQTVKEKKEGWEHWQRFFNKETINLIQCAEQLEAPLEVLEKSYSNCTWQNWTLEAVKRVAKSTVADRHAHLSDLGLKFGLDQFPTETTLNGEKFARTALQYIETHDHPRFVCHYGTKLFNDAPLNAEKELKGEGKGGLWDEKVRPYLIWQAGKRDELWFKVQPHLIGLLTAKGIPMLYQGQELGENYYLPPMSWGRANIFRPVRWEYFYDRIGTSMISLVRKLMKLRQQPQFRSLNGDGYYFHNNYDRYQSKGVLIFSRKHDNHFSIVALNFDDAAQTVQFRFPDDTNFQLPKDYSGNYREELDGKLNLKGITKDGEHELEIPSNYGCIWTLKSSI